MKKFATIFSIAFLGTSVVCFAQSTQKFTADKTNEYALVYSLPMTVVDITVETEHTIKQPGEFFNYATRHLGLSDKNVIRQPEHLVVVKSVTITPRGTADPDNRWQVQFKNGSGVTMSLMEDGVPLAINTDADAPVSPQLPKAVPAQPTPLESPAAREAVTEEMTLSTTIGRKAQAAANRIFELRERRNDIFSGDAEAMPPDGRATELVLAGLSAQEAALTAMFTGTVKTFTEVSTITFTPRKEDESKVLLARVSPIEGVVAKDDLSGIPLYLSYEILTRGKLPENEKGEAKKFPKGGVAYSIPGSARISLHFNGNIIGSADVDIAQLGVVFGIDPALFTDKKAPAFVEFSPVTGAIVKLGSK
ncbi:MAG: DUF4831 family protein [Muribaculaceae bacterium]|nr:DUF4831 family protein [Muribaculaceae bacterium]